MTDVFGGTLNLIQSMYWHQLLAW